MDVDDYADAAVSGIAAAIGEPARARMLYCLVDGHARTSTELAMVADVSPSTASAHLNRLKREHLVKVLVQGKHHYYSLEGPNVASALEGLASWRAARAARSLQARPAGFVPHGLATITSRARWACRSMIASRPGGGCQPIRRASTMHTTSPWMERGRLRRLALTWRQPGRCAAGSRTHAWIGVSGGLMLAGRWGQPC